MYGSHIIGSNFNVRRLQGDSFEVTLNIFYNCNSSALTGPNNEILYGVFDRLTHDYIGVGAHLVNIKTTDTIEIGDECYTPNTDIVCVVTAKYVDTITLPPNDNGYYVNWVNCCRNGEIQNIFNPGATSLYVYQSIYDVSVENVLSGFEEYPRQAYFCTEDTNYLNMPYTNPDGDSLVFSLIPPLHIPPFSGFAGFLTYQDTVAENIPWAENHSFEHILGDSSVIKIDSKTGEITVYPDLWVPQDGALLYIFGVKIEEYKNGQKIAETIRDIQVPVLNCKKNVDPDFDVASSSIKFTTQEFDLFEKIEKNAVFSDNNTEDSVIFVETIVSDTSVIEVSTQSGKQGVADISFEFNCDNFQENPYTINFKYRDNDCRKKLSNSTVFNFIPSRASYLEENSVDESTFSDVFSPNNDGRNDIFQINLNACVIPVSLLIHDRWGNPVFIQKNSDNWEWWNGYKYNDINVELPEGVYYYTFEYKTYINNTIQRVSKTVTLFK